MELNNKSLFKQECYIGGKWINSLSGKTIEVENPATQETIGIVQKCDAKKLVLPQSRQIMFQRLEKQNRKRKIDRSKKMA